MMEKSGPLLLDGVSLRQTSSTLSRNGLGLSGPFEWRICALWLAANRRLSPRILNPRPRITALRLCIA
jgi:hypothetical protein